MRIGFFGAGNAGTVLGRYFTSKKITVSGYYNRTAQKAIDASTATNSAWFKTTHDLVYNSDIIFITTSDDAIQEACSSCGNVSSKIVCHVSGAKDSNFNTPTYASASFHPPIAFTSPKMNIDTLDNITFVVEGSGEGFAAFLSFLSEHNINFVQINSGDKPLYHAAACIVSNYMATLIGCGQSVLESIGLNIDIFNGLISHNIDNILKTSPTQALTGPIMRGDISTVKLHLAALPQSLLPVYKLLGTETLKMTNLSAEQKQSILDILQN